MGPPPTSRKWPKGPTAAAPMTAVAPPAAADDIRPPTTKTTAWSMALYVRQPFPDNHVPASFLSKLVTNGAISRPALLPTILAACVVAQQLSVAVLFLLAFTYVQAGRLSLRSFLLLDLGLALVGLALIPSNQDKGGTSGKGRKGAVLGWSLLFTMGLRVLSPVLRTLTSSYADDSVQALALSLLGAHLLFHDYRAPELTTEEHMQQQDVPEPHHGTLALNAAVFAAVLLASRLPSNEAVFCLTLLAAELFAFFPLARHRLRRRSPTTAHLALTVLLVVACTALLHGAGQAALAALYLSTVAFLVGACPLWLQLIHAHKFTIQGPWDVASLEKNLGASFEG